MSQWLCKDPITPWHRKVSTLATSLLFVEGQFNFYFILFCRLFNVTILLHPHVKQSTYQLQYCSLGSLWSGSQYILFQYLLRFVFERLNFKMTEFTLTFTKLWHFVILNWRHFLKFNYGQEKRFRARFALGTSRAPKIMPGDRKLFSLALFSKHWFSHHLITPRVWKVWQRNLEGR